MKRIKRIVAAVAVLLILLVVSAAVWIDRIAEVGIEKGSSFALGVKTSLDTADIGVLSGRSALAGLTVNNPEGFSGPHFLQLGEGTLNISLGSLTTDTVEVPEFTLTGVDVYLEKKGLKGNYKVIMDNLGRFESGERTGTEERKGKKFMVREIKVNDVNVHVALLPVGGSLSRVTVPIDEIRLQNVGTESNKGLVLAELAGTLIQAILTAAADKGGGVIPPDVLGELQAGLGNLDSLAAAGASLTVSVQDSVRQVAEQGRATAEKAAQDAVDKLNKGLGDLMKKDATEKED